MISKSSIAIIALLLGSGAAGAETVKIAAATSAEQCLKQSFELADKITTLELTEAALDRLDDMLSEMEQHCESNRFADAAALANSISAEIEQPEQ